MARSATCRLAKEQAAAVRAFAASHPFVDSDRIGVWGWSGGGSNTLNAMFRFPDVFKVGVSVAPVPDQRLYDTIYQERYMGLPQENAEGYRIGLADQLRRGAEGQAAHRSRIGRRQRADLPGTERLVNRRLVELGKPFDLDGVSEERIGDFRKAPGTSLHVHSLIARYFLDHLPPSRPGRGQ